MDPPNEAHRKSQLLQSLKTKCFLWERPVCLRPRRCLISLSVWSAFWRTRLSPSISFRRSLCTSLVLALQFVRIARPKFWQNHSFSKQQQLVLGDPNLWLVGMQWIRGLVGSATLSCLARCREGISSFWNCYSSSGPRTLDQKLAFFLKIDCRWISHRQSLWPGIQNCLLSFYGSDRW